MKCTAPTRGHKSGSTEEQKCPVHGKKKINNLLKNLFNSLSSSEKWGVPEENIHSAEIPLPERTLQILDSLRQQGLKPVVVGGYVRDHVLGTPSKDIDIEVYGSQGIDDLINKLPAGVNEVGKSFGVLKLKVGEDEIDFSLPRTESKNGAGHRGFDVIVSPDLSITEAAERRDLTINAMAYDPFDHSIIDPYGGYEDLHNHVLRAVSNKFSEDPLRVMRLAGFAGRYDMDADSNTITMCKSLASEKQTLSMDRVRGEVEKIFVKSINPTNALVHLQDSNWYDVLGDNPKKETILIDAAMNQYDQGDRRRIALGINALFVNNKNFNRKWLQHGEQKTGKAFHDEYHTLWENISDVRKADRRCRKAKVSIKEISTLKTSMNNNGNLYGYDTEDFKEPLINGNDLIKLGAKPGPHFVKILSNVVNAQDEDKILTKKEGLDFAREIIKTIEDSNR